MVEAEGDRDEGRLPARRAERELAADAPVGPEIAGADLVADGPAVGISEQDCQSLETSLVDEERRAFRPYVARGQRSDEPEPLSLISARLAVTGEGGSGRRRHLGADFCRLYGTVRRAELAKFERQVTPLEYDWYLRQV